MSFFCLSACINLYHNDCFLSEQDPNQLIRGSALRVLSSIRVPVIAPIMMLAIKEVSSNNVHIVIAIFSLDVARVAPLNCIVLSSEIILFLVWLWSIWVFKLALSPYYANTSKCTLHVLTSYNLIRHLFHPGSKPELLERKANIFSSFAFFLFFGLDPAQISKQKIVHHHGPSNINLAISAGSFNVCWAS